MSPSWTETKTFIFKKPTGSGDEGLGGELVVQMRNQKKNVIKVLLSKFQNLIEQRKQGKENFQEIF